VGVGEIVGGFGGPGLAGIAGDTFGASTPFWMAVAACIIASGLALLVNETAPRIVGQSTQSEAGAAA
jgi:hypothetical protein